MSEPNPRQDVITVVRVLTSLLKLRRLHEDLDNVVFAEPVDKLVATLVRVFEHERSLQLEARDDLVFANRRIVRGLSQVGVDEFGAAFGDAKLGGLWLGAALDASEVRRFLGILQSEGDGDEPSEGIGKALTQWGLQSKVRVLAIGEVGGTAESHNVQIGEAAYFPLAYARLIVLLRELARNQSQPELGRYFRQKLHRAAGEIAGLGKKHPERLMALLTIRNTSPNQDFSRLANTGLLALLLGQRLGLTRRQLADMVLSSYLSGLDQTLGAKDRAFGSFVRGRDLSYKALCSAVVALGHSGRLPDATGHRPEGEHPFGQIIALCMAYQDLTTDTDDRAGLRPDEAVKVLLEAKDGRHDPTLVKLLANMLGLYPCGTVVRLSTGETAVVVYPNPGFPGRPLVSVALSPEGETGDGRLVDVAEKDVQGEFRVTIQDTLGSSEHQLEVANFLLG
jgi:hypothetical protein